MAIVEFWVMREVVTRPQFKRLAARDRGPLVAKVKSGDFVCLPNGTILEPISEHRSQEEALAAATVQTERTGKTHCVVLNADVSSSEAVDAILRRGAIMG